MAGKNKITTLLQKPNLIWPIVVLLIALGLFYFRPWQTTPEQLISVTATGTARATPNVANITATITSTNPDIDIARQETDAAVTKSINGLKELGIPEKDIKTQNISAGQTYETMIYPPGPRTTTNQYSVSLDITIRDFKTADQILALLTQNSASNIYGPNLQVDNAELETAKSQARQNAVENAKVKAGELAQAADRNIGKVISIKEQGDYGVPMPMYARGGADLLEKASTIQPGQDEVTITLLVDFNLK